MNEFIKYANQGAVRSLPLSDKLVESLSFLPELGVTMEVFSGGQPSEGSARVGSHRHDDGNAADVFFYKDGKRLNWANPEDRPLFEEIVRRGRSSGLTGFGAGQGYMRPGSMHIGFGTPAVWGAGGKGENAPGWLRSAYQGAPSTPNSGQQPQQIAQQNTNATPTGNASVEPNMPPAARPSPRPEMAQQSENENNGLMATLGATMEENAVPLLELLAQQQQQPNQMTPRQAAPQGLSLADYVQGFLTSRQS